MESVPPPPWHFLNTKFFSLISACEWVCVFVYVSEWVSVFVMISHVDKAWICSAEEFLELYGKIEAVVRICMLRWLGQLVEVAGTPLFDQFFALNTLAFFVLR